MSPLRTAAFMCVESVSAEIDNALVCNLLVGKRAESHLTVCLPDKIRSWAKHSQKEKGR